jgi:hypothetical protein
MDKNPMGKFLKVFAAGTLAALASLQIATWAGCVDEDERKFKLTYKVLNSVECVPWQLTDESEELCLCFGEPKFNSIFAFIAPDSLCFDVDEDGNVLYDYEEDETGTGSTNGAGNGTDTGTGSMGGTDTGDEDEYDGTL